ncbi:MAG: right-handed parallel beta-helix repeat-containing protein [Planctomycetota bacterium]|jgi:alpha-N-arabinofuranosidase
MIKKTTIGLMLLMCTVVMAEEYHVSKSGGDADDGSATRPFKTITAAARVAQPGDTITVHEGIYRERIDPPRGGTSDTQRIVYRAAPGEKVAIKGSEVITGWQKVQNDTWKVVIPNSFFGNFNPYKDLINGDWFNPRGREHHTGAVYLNGHWLVEAAKLEEVLEPTGEAAGDTRSWFAQVDSSHTTIWAQFKDLDPNENLVEINVRRSVFYPEKPGMNYITVRGFALMHAATPWAPPTAEQIGLIGTHWSKDWIIENNDIQYSVCTGITLGKHGDEFDNTSQNSAEGYVKAIERARKRGWSRDKIGNHIIRNNHVSHCEQAGIVGSMGPVFCTVTGNTIHDIHVRRLFTGAEMAGIKFHGAVDTEISGNHIYRTNRGIWLDWMTQGTRVTCNLLHDNGPSEDLFVEVNHGPFLVDNNLFLSRKGLLVNSQGGAYVHNLIAGSVHVHVGESRLTPHLEAHSTEVKGLAPNASGDERYYNNLFVNHGLAEYDPVKLPVFMAGNVFLSGAKPSKHETRPLVQPDVDPGLELVEEPDGLYLQILVDEAWARAQRPLVTTDLLGKAKTPELPYEKPDGSPYRIDIDYHGRNRDGTSPGVGPFEFEETGKLLLKVW